MSVFDDLAKEPLGPQRTSKVFPMANTTADTAEYITLFPRPVEFNLHDKAPVEPIKPFLLPEGWWSPEEAFDHISYAANGNPLLVLLGGVQATWCPGDNLRHFECMFGFCRRSYVDAEGWLHDKAPEVPPKGTWTSIREAVAEAARAILPPSAKHGLWVFNNRIFRLDRDNPPNQAEFVAWELGCSPDKKMWVDAELISSAEPEVQPVRPESAMPAAEAKPEREISDDLAACLLSVRSGHSPKPSPEIREVAVDLSRFTMPGDAALEDKGIGDIPTAFWPDLD